MISKFCFHTDACMGPIWRNKILVGPCMVDFLHLRPWLRHITLVWHGHERQLGFSWFFLSWWSSDPSLETLLGDVLSKKCFRSHFLPRILIPKSVQGSSLLSEKCFQDFVVPQVFLYSCGSGTVFGLFSYNKVEKSSLCLMQCSGSVTFWYGSGFRSMDHSYTYGSGSRSCSFRRWLLRFQQKIIFFNFFGLLLSVGSFASVFKDKKSLRGHWTSENKFFKKFFIFFWLVDGRWKDPDPYKIITDPDPGGPKKHTDPAPEHWFAA